MTSRLLRAAGSNGVGFPKGLPGGDCRGLLGLSGAKQTTSNAQGVGRQRAPRAAEFVSKNTITPGVIDSYYRVNDLDVRGVGGLHIALKGRFGYVTVNTDQKNGFLNGGNGPARYLHVD